MERYFKNELFMKCKLRLEYNIYAMHLEDSAKQFAILSNNMHVLNDKVAINKKGPFVVMGASEHWPIYGSAFMRRENINPQYQLPCLLKPSVYKNKSVSYLLLICFLQGKSVSCELLVKVSSSMENCGIFLKK